MTVKIPSVETVEYGRRVIERDVERLKDFTCQAIERGDTEQAEDWRRIESWLHRSFLGGEGCVITAFDSRWLNPEFRSIMEEVHAAPADPNPED